MRSIKACHHAGIAAVLSEPMTSNAKAEDGFDKIDLIHIAHVDECRCPARERAAMASRTRKADCSSGARGDGLPCARSQMGCERKTPVPGRGTIKPCRAGLARTYVDSGRGGACDGLH